MVAFAEEELDGGWNVFPDVADTDVTDRGHAAKLDRAGQHVLRSAAHGPMGRLHRIFRRLSAARRTAEHHRFRHGLQDFASPAAGLSLQLRSFRGGPESCDRLWLFRPFPGVSTQVKGMPALVP